METNCYKFHLRSKVLFPSPVARKSYHSRPKLLSPVCIYSLFHVLFSLFGCLFFYFTVAHRDRKYYYIIVFLLEFTNNSYSDWILSLILRHSKGIYKSIFPFAGLSFSPGHSMRIYLRAMILRGSVRRICHLENVKSYMSYFQQYTKIIKKLTLKTYFSLIVSNLKRTRSQITSNLSVSNWKSSMTSCWSCPKVVNNISQIFFSL